MAVSFRMRRIPPEDLDKGLQHLEAAFEATLGNAVWDAETEAGVLCDIGEDSSFPPTTSLRRPISCGPLTRRH